MAKEEKGKEETTTAPKAIVEKLEYKNIYSALSAFQGELEPIEKTAQVRFKTKAGEIVDFKYAPLDATMKFIYPLLAKHGLSVRHELGEAHVECILTHETTCQEITMAEEEVVDVKVGTNRDIKEAYDQHTKKTETPSVFVKNELRSGKLFIDTKKSDMKEVGGQITYGRRYTLGLVLGLATEEDKDTELMDMARKNVEDFAFTQAKKTIESIDIKKDAQKLTDQVTFLEKELALAEAMEAGAGTKAPSLGLKAEQLRSLITVAKAKVGKTNDAPSEETA